jgi:hypothetical protein
MDSTGSEMRMYLPIFHSADASVSAALASHLNRGRKKRRLFFWSIRRDRLKPSPKRPVYHNGFHSKWFTARSTRVSRRPFRVESFDLVGLLASRDSELGGNHFIVPFQSGRAPRGIPLIRDERNSWS